MHTPPKPSRARARITSALGSTKAAIDLASVMVGVLVIGVVSGIAAVVVFGVIPWAQDEAAKGNVASAMVAQSSAKVTYGEYLTGDKMEADGLLEASPSTNAAIDEDATCYLAASRSDTGAIFAGDSSSMKPRELHRSDTNECLTKEEVNALVASIGGWPDAAPVTFGDAKFDNGTVGVEYSSKPSFTSASPVRFAVIGSLPTGLTIDKSSGTISGTPAAAGTFAFTLKATNDDAVAERGFTIKIERSAPTITIASLPDATRGVSYNAPISHTGEDVTLALSLGTFPDGLDLDPTTDSLVGTPTATGTFSFTISARNSGGSTAQAFTVRVGIAAPSISTAALPDGVKGVGYSQTLAWTGDDVAFATSLGSLPAGLALNSATGAITGTPSTAATSAFTITATNAGGSSARAFSVKVELAAPTISTTTLPQATKGSAYAATVVFTGEGATATVTSGSLPAGLVLNTSSGVISGTPTAAATSSFTVQAANGGGSVTRALSIKVELTAPTLTTSSLNRASNMTPYSMTLVGTGEATTHSLSGALPAGVVFNAATGAFSGTPTAIGTWSITVTKTNSGGSASKVYILEVVPRTPVITTNALPDAQARVAYSFRIINSTDPGEWSIFGGSLPPGMTLDATTGVISGTTPTAGTWTFEVIVENDYNDDAQAFTLRVK